MGCAMLENQNIKELICKAQQGDREAEEQILQANINLVRSIVHRFINRGYEWDDLFQIGCMGLIKAIERFDLSFSVKFSTYAVPMIIGEIKRFIRDDNPIKVSRSIKELAYRVHKVQEKLQGKLGREPTINEVAQELALAPQEIVSALEAIQPPQSLYEQAYHDDGDPIQLMDQIKCAGGLEESYFENLALKEVVQRLPDRERAVIQLRFFSDKTQSQIAEMLGISQVQVSRIEKQAMKLLRKHLDLLN